ncbi:MAG: 1-phosphofructokinase, partial [candidate division WOR-3 bacterium]
MILTVTLNPSVDEAIFVDELRPHDTNGVLRVEVDAGGKGINVARVASALGSEVVATGFLGGKPGRFVQAVLKEEGVETDFIWLKQPTRRNLCIEERGEQPPTLLNEAGPHLEEQEWQLLQEKVRGWLPKARWVTFGGSLPPGLPRDAYRSLIQMAHEAGVPCVLDSDGPPMIAGLEAKPTLIKPNDLEAERLLGAYFHSDLDFIGAVEQLAAKGIPYVIISHGARGATAYSPEGLWKATPPIIHSKSTIGSGDSMIAGMVHILAQGGSFEEALRWGTAAGAATAMSSGAEIANRQGVEQLLPQVQVKRW